MEKSSYLCRIVRHAPSEATDDLTIEEDVFRRLSCWNINFAKVSNHNGRSNTKRLRRVRRHDAPLMGLPSVRLIFRHTCWRGTVSVAYPDG